MCRKSRTVLRKIHDPMERERERQRKAMAGIEKKITHPSLPRDNSLLEKKKPSETQRTVVNEVIGTEPESDTLCKV